MSADVSIEHTPRAGLVLRCQRCDITEANLSDERLAKLLQQHDHGTAPWRFDVPEPPASVTALKDRDGDVWLRLSRSKWSGASWPGDSRSFADLLDFAPLVECDDPRAAS